MKCKYPFKNTFPCKIYRSNYNGNSNPRVIFYEGFNLCYFTKGQVFISENVQGR